MVQVTHWPCSCVFWLNPPPIRHRPDRTESVCGRSFTGIVGSKLVRSWCLFIVNVEFCKVGLNGPGWSIVQMSRTECGVIVKLYTLRTVGPIYRTGIPLPSRCCILYILFQTNISTQYFKHAAHSQFFSSKCLLFHNATFFGSCIIHILHTGVLKFKCKIPVPKDYIWDGRGSLWGVPPWTKKFKNTFF